MKDKIIQAHMRTAYNYANCSSAVRLKVGAIVVKNDAIISIGYNGQPAGWDNVCEHKVYMDSDAGGWLDPGEIEERWPFVDANGRYLLKTKPTVLHAESNALAKLAKSTISSVGASLFVTHSPCLPCALQTYQAEIAEVYYAEDYRSNDGIEFLKECNIPVIKVNV